MPAGQETDSPFKTCVLCEVMEFFIRHCFGKKQPEMIGFVLKSQIMCMQLCCAEFSVSQHSFSTCHILVQIAFFPLTCLHLTKCDLRHSEDFSGSHI